MENIKLSKRKTHSNVFDAIASGASEGMMVSLNVIAMLLAIVALIAMIDYILAACGGFIYNVFHLTGPVLGFDFPHLSLKMILGKFFAIFAWLMGTPVKDIFDVGGVIGLKIVSNEVYGYTDLIAVKDIISHKAFVICSFANSLPAAVDNSADVLLDKFVITTSRIAGLNWFISCCIASIGSLAAGASCP